MSIEKKSLINRGAGRKAVASRLQPGKASEIRGRTGLGKISVATTRVAPTRGGGGSIKVGQT